MRNSGSATGIEGDIGGRSEQINPAVGGCDAADRPALKMAEIGLPDGGAGTVG